MTNQRAAQSGVFGLAGALCSTSSRRRLPSAVFRWSGGATSSGGSRKIAEFWMPVAAVVDQKRQQRLHAVHVRTIDDRSSFAGTPQQPRPDQDGKVRR